ncbi:hypothetical protein [Streptomyces sp. WL006]|uniref:hypothetical protein n=1 Tax=Streptomyces sp. WL006 TaxID=3423915 RepID=UPI003F6B8AA6
MGINLTPSTSSTSSTSIPVEEEIIFTQPAFQSTTPMEISGEDMGHLVAFLETQLTNLPKEHHNTWVCQSLTSILDQASKVYGSNPSNPQTCICRG